MALLTAARAAALLRSMRGRRVLVLGDVMLDEFVWGRVSRISPEAPVPVVQVTRQTFQLGGAGNVAASVRALGGSVVLAGVVGRDAAGERVREALAAAGVESRLVALPGDRPTTVKTRIVAHNQQVVRADHEDPSDVPAPVEAALVESIRRDLPGSSALVISDYQKGVVTASLLRRVLPLARRHRVPVLVDPKVRHFRRYRGVTVVTPNQVETELATGRRVQEPSDLVAAGRRVLSLLACRAVLVTRGEQGMSLFERGRPPLHVAAAAREVFDVTGAGDTVIATMALALAAGASLPEAAALANCAAGVVVAKVGTAQAAPAEVLAAARLAVRRRSPRPPPGAGGGTRAGPVSGGSGAPR
jgi:D-beta-D-heptose 7-phosphate kinase/D-beta-D-heptose 1-phosphate adenosyltransferase